jgi:DNA-binding XRE family transcriptional regulator
MIYAIVINDEFCKIGFTNNIRQRMKQLQVANPMKMDLMFLVEGDLNEETHLHKAFNHLNIKGEWFKLSPEIENYFKLKECLKWKYGLEKNNTSDSRNLIKSERIKNGLTADELARKLNISKGSLMAMQQREERGSISLNNLEKVAKIFGKKLEYRFV